MEIQQKTTLSAKEKEDISSLILSVLHEKLLPVLGEKEKALLLLNKSYVPKNCFFITKNNSIVAFLAFKTKSGGFIAPSFTDFFRVYGVSGFIRALILGIIDYKPKAKELHLEAVAVDKTMRGKGVGSQLIQRFFEFTKKNEYKITSLEVIDTNKKAFSLYEKLGFSVEKNQL